MRAKGKSRSRSGFTIVELMVVMLIMLLLLAVLAPTVQKIHRTIMRGAALSTVRLIDGACKMYREDLGEYPPSTHPDYPGWSGGQLLTLLLTGYGPDPDIRGEPGLTMNLDDGREGYGFRMERAGKIFGPYNGTEKVVMKLVDGRPVFMDAFDEQLYYYRFDATSGTYHATDDPAPSGLEGPAHADYLASAKATQTNFILMTAGPDGYFSGSTDTDDITNFLEEQQ